jgi:hypothetical protein
VRQQEPFIRVVARDARDESATATVAYIAKQAAQEDGSASATLQRHTSKKPLRHSFGKDTK